MGNRAAQFRTDNGGCPVKGRGRRHIEFDLGGGVTRRISTIEPLHYGAASDQEIADTWEPDTGAWQWRMVSNSFNLHARDYLNAGDLVEWLDVDTGESVTVQPLALNWVDNVTNSRQQIAIPQAVQATASDNVLYWENGYGTGRHFRYVSHPERLIKHLVIDSLAAFPTPIVSNPWLEIEFIVKKSTGCSFWVDGVAWDNSTRVETGNRIEVRLDATDAVLWYFDAPTAMDSAGGMGPSHCAGVLQLRRQGANRYCTVRFPKAWVDGATFPITLDPTINAQIGAGGNDGRWEYTGGGTDYYSNSEAAFAFGYPASGYNRISAWFRFTGIQFTGAPTVSAAKLSLYTPAGSFNALSSAATIRAVDADDPSAPSSQADANGRTLTTASASWTTTNSPTGAWYDTADFASVVQEIADSYNYLSSAKALVVYVYFPADATGGQWIVRGYEGSTSDCATLTVEYTSGLTLTAAQHTSHIDLSWA